MKQFFKNQFILVLGICLAFIACNNNDKKTEPAGSDTATTTTTETTQPTTPADPDALKANPELYKLIKDTMGIRVLEATYKPGESSVMHSHADYSVYAISGGMADFTAKDGTTQSHELKTGATMIHGAEIHSVKNTGKTTIKVLLVEVSRPAGNTPSTPLDATKVAADEYKVRNDSLGIRIVEVNYKPGQSSAMHSHPDLVLYVLKGGTAEFTEKDGTKHTDELGAGLTAVVPAASHSAKNVGKSPFKALLIEVGR